MLASVFDILYLVPLHYFSLRGHLHELFPVHCPGECLRGWPFLPVGSGNDCLDLSIWISGSVHMDTNWIQNGCDFSVIVPLASHKISPIASSLSLVLILSVLNCLSLLEMYCAIPGVHNICPVAACNYCATPARHSEKRKPWLSPLVEM